MKNTNQVIYERKIIIFLIHEDNVDLGREMKKTTIIETMKILGEDIKDQKMI